MAWLLDTNVLSELRRPKPELKVVEFVSAQPLDQLYVSTVTLAEIPAAKWYRYAGRSMRNSAKLPVSKA